jgi:exopolyphosphatase / guanosine-5'-triphosphate,3'-diphosphate pyrophosphatase
MRLFAAEFSAPGRWSRMESIRAPVRLGVDAFGSGTLTPEIMDDAVAAMHDFRARLEALGVRHLRAAGTSALREAENGDELVRRIRAATGIELERITGAEEARLVWIAIRDRVALGADPWLLVDLGGGSVEVSSVDENRIRWSESLPLGTVRLLSELGRNREAAPELARRMIEDPIHMLSLAAAGYSMRFRGVLATGGNIEALADLVEAERREEAVRVIPLARMRETIATLAALTAEQRMARFDLRPDRADVILPAAIVYERVAALAGVDEILVPDVGLKEGILLDLADELLDQRPHEGRLEAEITESAVSLGRRYQFDEPHARQVARLALALFDQLEGEHRLGSRERRVLLAAALLHDIGQFVSYRKHHKHSHYLISHAEVAGLSPDEVALAALVARYHRRSEPRAGHDGYDALTDGDRARLSKLAGILRTADALDREHDGRVSNVEATVTRSQLQLAITGTGDLLPELWALRSKAGLLERALGRELVIGCRAA